MPRAKTPATRNASHEGAGSEAVNAMAARTAPAILELLADGVPRSKPAIVEAPAGRHAMVDVVHTPIRLAPASATPNRGGGRAIIAAL